MSGRSALLGLFILALIFAGAALTVGRELDQGRRLCEHFAQVEAASGNRFPVEWRYADGWGCMVKLGDLPTGPVWVDIQEFEGGKQ